MDFAGIQTALATWAKSVTSLPVRWENQTPAMQLTWPAQIVLTGPVNTETVGTDYVEWADSGDDMQPTVVGHREFDVMIRVCSRSQAGNKTAGAWLEQLRIALSRPSTLEAFDAAEFAWLECGKAVQFDAPVDGRWESIASMTLRCSAVVTDAGDASAGALTGVKLTSTLDGADGTTFPSPPNFADELITGE